MDTQLRPIEFPKKMTTADLIVFYADGDRYLKSMEPSRMMDILQRINQKPIAGHYRKMLDGMIKKLSKVCNTKN
jgi:hypothetical protein